MKIVVYKEVKKSPLFVGKPTLSQSWAKAYLSFSTDLSPVSVRNVTRKNVFFIITLENGYLSKIGRYLLVHCIVDFINPTFN